MPASRTASCARPPRNCKQGRGKELKTFKKLSGDYQSADIERMLKNGDLHEICKGGKEW